MYECLYNLLLSHFGKILTFSVFYIEIFHFILLCQRKMRKNPTHRRNRALLYKQDTADRRQSNWKLAMYHLNADLSRIEIAKGRKIPFSQLLNNRSRHIILRKSFPFRRDIVSMW